MKDVWKGFAAGLGCLLVPLVVVIVAFCCFLSYVFLHAAVVGR